MAPRAVRDRPETDIAGAMPAVRIDREAAAPDLAGRIIHRLGALELFLGAGLPG